MKRQIMILGACVFVVAAGVLILPRQSASQASLLDQLRAFTPARIIADAQRFPDRFGRQSPIDIVYKAADLDGSGSFDFVVAAYSDGIEGALRVFRRDGGELQVLADLSESIDVGGGEKDLELVDVNEDGKPEIVLEAHGVRTDYSLLVMAWTESGLAVLTPGNGITDGDLTDLDGDGVLEIVQPPPCFGGGSNDIPVHCEGEYKVYKLQDGIFKVVSSSPFDPTGRLNSSGDLQAVFAHRAVLDPGHFPLAAIQNAIQGNDPGGVVTLRLGNLTAGASPDLVDVTQIDADSLRLNRTLRVLSAIVVVPSSDDAQTTTSTSTTTPTSTAPLLTKFQGAVIQATFSRADFLKLLPRAQTDGPLAAGQSVSLDIDGKMKNGTPLFGVVKVQIEGQP